MSKENWENFLSEMNESKEQETNALKDIKKILKKYKKADFVRLFSNILFESDINYLNLEFICQNLWGKIVQQNLPKIEKIYKILSEKNITKKKYFNDGDDAIYFIPDVDKKIFVHTTQNINYIYIIDKSYLHIRRWYNMKKPAEDKWQKEEDNLYKTKGIRHAIEKADWLSSEYSDCYKTNKYPKRPSLKYFEDKNFTVRYNDGRDVGYILTYCFFHKTVESAEDNFTHLNIIFNCCISYVLKELEKE